MRGKHCLLLTLTIGVFTLAPLCAHADSLVFALNETSVVDALSANTTLSQDVLVNWNTTLDGMGFFLSDPSGAAITYSITDLTTDSTLFTETFDDTTLNPSLTSIAIPEGTKQWLELYLPPTLLSGGTDIYQFSLSGAGAMNVGIDPTSTSENGIQPSGSAVLGLRVWAVTPEPDALVLLGTGTCLLAFAALKRRQWAL